MKQYQIGTNYQQKELGTSNIQTTNRNPQIGNPKKRNHTLESRIFVRWSPEMIKRNRRASPPSRRVEEIEKKNRRRVAWERGGSDFFLFYSVCLINFKTRVLETFCPLMNVISVTFSFWCYFGDKNLKSAIMENCPKIYARSCILGSIWLEHVLLEPEIKWMQKCLPFYTHTRDMINK